jgi:signal transduction histidine kinase
LAIAEEQANLDDTRRGESALTAAAPTPDGRQVNASERRRGVAAPSGRALGGRGRRSLRLRLSLLYGGLFLVSGVVLLAVTYALAVHLPTVNPVVNIPAGAIKVSPPLIHAGVTSERTALLRGLLLRSSLALALMAAVSVWLGWLMAGRVLRPLRTITATTRQISEENLHRRLALSGPEDELQELGDTIDGLLGRLEGAFDAQRSFVANASHELRTPLASMRVAIDVTTRKSSPVSKDAASLAGRIRTDLGQADRILESLLVLARAQRGVMTDLESVSLGSVVEQVLAAHAQAAVARGISVHSALDEVRVFGDETLLGRMAANLVDNAIRHNDVGEFVNVTVKTYGPTACMTVESGGPLLPVDKIGELTQPFRRLVADRTGSDDGVGLGLSIVAAITTAHHGTLELRGRPEGGLCVTVTLPRAADATEIGLSQ